jgi:hypothetical protein
MESESSLWQSQVPTTCPYTGSARSSPYSHIPLPEDVLYCGIILIPSVDPLVIVLYREMIYKLYKFSDPFTRNWCSIINMRHNSWDRSDSFFRVLVSFNRDPSWYDLSGNFARSQGNTSIKHWRFLSLGLATTCVYRQNLSLSYSGVVLHNYPCVKYSPWIFEVININRGTTHWLPLGHVALSLVQWLYCGVILICVCVSSVQYKTGCYTAAWYLLTSRYCSSFCIYMLELSSISSTNTAVRTPEFITTK